MMKMLQGLAISLGVGNDMMNGIYSVKAGYYKAHYNSSSSEQRASSSAVMSPTAWNQLWNSKLIPRVKHFVWRALNNAIATKEALHRRHRTPSNICTICEKDPETLEHLFFDCPWTKWVWFGSQLSIRIEDFKANNFVAWWINITENLQHITDVEMSQIALILWNIWKQRNDKVFNTRDLDPTAVIRTVSKQNLIL